MGFRAFSIPEEDSPDRSLSTDPVESIDWHSMIRGMGKGGGEGGGEEVEEEEGGGGGGECCIAQWLKEIITDHR